jgi:Protein of unknown function with HXXEE motif
VIVGAGVIFQLVWLGRAASFLGVALAASYLLWLGGAWSGDHPSLPRTYAIGLLVFVAHASEEFLTGFQRRLPALVGDRWTDMQYLVFNATWLVAFVAAGLALRRARPPLAILIVVFFAIGGGVGNGVAHLLLVILQRGYFPGAWTAPLCLIVGVALLRQLFTPAHASKL